jgi:hypothetical protein
MYATLDTAREIERRGFAGRGRGNPEDQFLPQQL